MGRTAEKISLFSEWMKGDHVFVHLDARRDGVIVPAHLRETANLKLKLSYGFQGEISQDDLGVSAYLKFNGQYEQCVLPWSAIWGLSNEEGETCLWTEELPAELAHLGKLPKMEPKQLIPAQAPKLSVVGKTSTRQKPELRRIK